MKPVVLAFSLGLTAFCFSQDPFVNSLKSIPRVREVKVSARGNQTQYEVMFDQPVDHTNPSGQHFLQRIFLVDRGATNPVILGTEGYSVQGADGGELRQLIPNANLLTVEHRYFGRSMPSPVDWKQLTIKNAADDMHDIVTEFKKLYSGKWVATGVSKGGQTSLFFKSFYPNDVDATVAYVAPINVAQEDPRIYRWLATVGDEDTRQRIKNLQIALLKREDEVLATLKPDPKDYSMGIQKAYEYGVLEFPFALWQYGTKPEGLPTPEAPVSELVRIYRQVNSMYYYSDAGIRFFQSFYYQAFTELGYYNYDITDFKPYLRNNPNPTNMELCPPATQGKIVYNPSTLSFVNHFLQYDAQNVIFVYGETDTWSATQMELIGRTNAVKIMVKGAHHNAAIRMASPEQKNKVFDALDGWLGMKLNRA